MKWVIGILAVMAIMHFFFRRAPLKKRDEPQPPERG